MQRRKIALFVSLLVLLPAGLSAAPAAETENKNAPAVKPAQTGKESALKMGMNADAVTKVMGKPVAIRPMEAPNGKAEVWVYVREVSTRMDRVGIPGPDTVTQYTGTDGKMHQTNTPGPTQYHDVHYVTEETIELLMFNQHFLTQKILRAERQAYQ